MNLARLRLRADSNLIEQGARIIPFRRPGSERERRTLQEAVSEGLVYEMGIDSFFGASHFMRPNGAVHTHSFRIQAMFETAQVDDHGMMLGFREVNDVLEAEARKYANRVLNDIEPFTVIEPTGENLAAIILRNLQTRLVHDVVGCPRLIALTLWENPTNFIRVTPRRTVIGADAR